MTSSAASAAEIDEEDDEHEPVAAPAEKASASAKPKTKVQAAKQVEAARAAAERRQRFEQRRRPGDPRVPATSEGGGRARPETRSMLVIGAGVAVLLVGIVFGASQLLGGDDGGGSEAEAPASGSTGPPAEVAVLNGTPVPGLAAKVGEEVRNAAGGYKLGVVTNAELPFETSTVLFDPSGQEDANAIAGALGIQAVVPLNSEPEIKKVVEDAPVVVVVGEDRADT